MATGAVLLVNPRTGVASNARMPLSIVHLTAVLEGRELLSCLPDAGLPAKGSSARDLSEEKIRKSRLRMAYIGAESGNDEALRRMRKGARVEHTIEVALRCRDGVIPEFSFVRGGPDAPSRRTPPRRGCLFCGTTVRPDPPSPPHPRNGPSLSGWAGSATRTRPG